MSSPRGERYAIRLAGQLDQRWSDWFEGFTLSTAADGTTVLVGTAADQAALHGLLRRIGDLGVTLISINPIDQPKEEDNDTPTG